MIFHKIGGTPLPGFTIYNSSKLVGPSVRKQKSSLRLLRSETNETNLIALLQIG